jgi:hypothetical protein
LNEQTVNKRVLVVVLLSVLVIRLLAGGIPEELTAHAGRLNQTIPTPTRDGGGGQPPTDEPDEPVTDEPEVPTDESEVPTEVPPEPTGPGPEATMTHTPTTTATPTGTFALTATAMPTIRSSGTPLPTTDGQRRGFCQPDHTGEPSCR